MATGNIASGQVAKEFFMGMRDDLYPSAVDQQGKISVYRDMARRLSQIARKTPPWGWKYIESVLHGTVQPSARLWRAAQLLAASLDGSDARISGMQAVQVYADPGTVAANAVVLAPSRHCADPSCRVQFVPVVPNQRYCPIHRPR